MTAEITAGDIAVRIPNAAKVLFPADGISKEDLARYYAAAAGRVLPWLRDRPVTMMRYPDGLAGQRIVQKMSPPTSRPGSAGSAQTVVAQYSVRARPGAPVATPLTWPEVQDPALDPGQFTISTVRGRLESTADPWDGFARKRHSLSRPSSASPN